MAACSTGVFKGTRLPVATVLENLEAAAVIATSPRPVELVALALP
jgi:hypothetical protein